MAGIDASALVQYSRGRTMLVEFLVEVADDRGAILARRDPQQHGARKACGGRRLTDASSRAGT